MPCTLYIPHLIPPREIAQALWRTVDAPALHTLLARATRSHSTQSPDALLCGLFGLTKQHDWPLAPLLARGENLMADRGYWLCATPCHLETRRNALVLSDPAALAISDAESSAFAATLSAHLREENIMLHAPRANQWFLQCDSAAEMTTTSLDHVLNRDVRPYLPQGPHSARWHRILTEIQMLLHAHPMNDAREARGLAPVNSVWLWAGGTLPASTIGSMAPFASVYSDERSVRALAQHAACPLARCPAQMPSTHLRALNKEVHFFSIDTLTAPIRRGDAQTWSRTVTALNRDWFQPLLQALRSRQLSTLNVLSVNDAGTQQWVIRPWDLMKFWRKNNDLQ